MNSGKDTLVRYFSPSNILLVTCFEEAWRSTGKLFYKNGSSSLTSLGKNIFSGSRLFIKHTNSRLLCAPLLVALWSNSDEYWKVSHLNVQVKTIILQSPTYLSIGTTTDIGCQHSSVTKARQFRHSANQL